MKPNPEENSLTLNLRLFNGTVENWVFDKTTKVEVKPFYFRI